MLLAARDGRSSSIYLSVILDLTISYGYAYRSSKHSISDFGFLRPLTNKENSSRWYFRSVQEHRTWKTTNICQRFYIILKSAAKVTSATNPRCQSKRRTKNISRLPVKISFCHILRNNLAFVKTSFLF